MYYVRNVRLDEMIPPLSFICVQVQRRRWPAQAAGGPGGGGDRQEAPAEPCSGRWDVQHVCCLRVFCGRECCITSDGTFSQVLLRYHVQQGIPVIPKSDKPHRILQNSKVKTSSPSPCVHVKNTISLMLRKHAAVCLFPLEELYICTCWSKAVQH